MALRSISDSQRQAEFLIEPRCTAYGMPARFLTRVLLLVPLPRALCCPLGGTGNSCISKASTLYSFVLLVTVPFDLGHSD